MTKLEAISIRLQTREIEVLQKYNNRVREENTQHFFWEKLDEPLKHDYPTLMALQALGFVSLVEEEKSMGTVYDSYYLTLLSSALYRSEYESYSAIKKWVVKQYLNYKDWMGVLAFFISLILVILKVLEFSS